MSAKILVVDDENDIELLIQQIFRRQIRKNEYSFIFASNGKDALNKLQENDDVDLILTDINMPEMDGLTFISCLPALNRSIEAIIISAYGDMENIRTAMNRGAHDFLTKPLEINELEITVKNTLAHLQQARDNVGLIQEKEAAKAESEAKSSFLAGMSHEIRTPLNAILGMTDLLVETNLDNTQKNYVKILDSAGEALLDLINDILDLSKIEAGRIELETISFDIHDLIEKISGIMSIKCNEKNLKLICIVDTNVPHILLGDPSRLRQIIINLIGNAVKFTDSGSIIVNVSLEDLNHGKVSLRFEVRDTGIGIPEDKLESIFDIFSQAESGTTRKYGGTGLGLSISRQLVKLMGGKIWAESVIDEGSSFCFTSSFGFKRSLVSRPPKRMKTSSIIYDTNFETLSSEATKLRESLRILVADDSEHNRIVIHHYMKNQPHIVTFAKNGLEALESFKNNQFDVVFMDMQMPEMDGYTSTREMRKWEVQNGREKTPIVALTAIAFKSEIAEAIESGCNECVSKPVRKAKFIDTLKKYSNYTWRGENFEQSTPLSQNLREVEIDRDMEDIVPDYLENLGEQVTVFTHALSQGDFDKINMEGHKLRGSGGSYGFDMLTDIGKKLEIAAINHEQTDIQDQIKELSEYLNSIKVVYV